MNQQINDNRFHIFYIHSSITEIVAMAIIKYKTLPPQNVIIMTNRNYILDQKNQALYKVFNMNVFEWLEKQIYAPHLTQLLNFMTLITNNHKYEMYLPHISRKIWKTFVLHCHCIKLNYIEEGTMSYVNFAYSEQERREHNIFNLYIDSKVNVYNLHSFKEYITNAIVTEDKKRLEYIINNVSFYAITDEAFPFAREATINVNEYIDRSKFQATLNANQKGVDKIILLPDTLNTYFPMQRHIYIKHLDELFKFIKNYITKLDKYDIYIKFHPGNTEEDKALWLEKIKEYDLFTTEININLEHEFMTQTEQMHVFAMVSSALYYAKVFNEDIHCYSKCKALFAEPEFGKEAEKYDISSNNTITQMGAFTKITYI